MDINITLGFIIPWLFGIYLLKNDMETILSISPFASLAAFAFNEIGLHIQWWEHVPTHWGPLSTFPSNVGIFPVTACFMIHFIKRNRKKHFVIIALFTIFLTALEGLLLVFDRVTYYNGWNIGWTFSSYLITNYLVYIYFKQLYAAISNRGDIAGL
ncbi:MAG: hypothetical protein K0R28_1917 [Paenibacillus sp.]|nr:hypothetical protein [Paenibacillus sp.]